MPERADPDEDIAGDVMAGDRRIARPDTALPDWYVSDASYRPIPIVWFAGAMLLQVITQPLLIGLLWGTLALPGPVVTMVSLGASGLIAVMTWRRGMDRAAPAWRVLTIAMLAFFFLLSALTVLS